MARREFLEIITHQAREYGRTTFFSTHLLDEVERAADRVGIIHRGKKRFEGKLSHLQDRVRRIRIDSETPLPEGFAMWRELDPEASDPENTRTLIVDADPMTWAGSGIVGQRLSLDDIFIACVGISTTRI